MRHRILAFCSESRGLGHLKRLSVIARRLAEQHSVLVVTSDHGAGELIQPPVEYMRIPPLATSNPNSAEHWDRPVFLDGQLKVLPLRTELVAAAFRTYRPHVMITDFFPVGRGGELLPHLQNPVERCLNYLVLRGVLGSESYTCSLLFSPPTLRVLSRHYERVFVACDNRVFSASEYNFPDHISRKITNVGYVYTPPDDDLRAVARASRKGQGDTPWIVCAAGSGLSSERLIERCYQLALLREDCKFTIVLGPRSRLKLAEAAARCPHVQLRTYEPQLSVLLSSCDIAIIHGGYNSLLESVYGGAAVIVVPYEAEEEQLEHAKRLSTRSDVRLTSLSDLEVTLDSCIVKHRMQSRACPPNLDVGGADKIAALINHDMESEAADWSVTGAVRSGGDPAQQSGAEKPVQQP